MALRQSICFSHAVLLLPASPIAGAEHLETVCDDGERSLTPRYTEALLLSWFLPVVASLANGGAGSPLQTARRWRRGADCNFCESPS